MSLVPVSGTLAAVEEAAAAVRAAEDKLDAERERLRVALVAAHEAGASITLLAKAVGLTHQRVSQIIASGPTS